MVTRRSTHANHAKPTVAKKRLANRRAASRGGALYAGGKPNARGGHVGNVAGYGGAHGGSGRRGGSADVGNVAGYGSASAMGSVGAHRRSSSASPSPSSPAPRGTSNGNAGGNGVRVPTPNGGEVLLTRRHFLYGALGVGALAAVGGGASVVIEQTKNDPDDNLVVLKVPEDAVLSSASDEFTNTFVQTEDPTTLMNQVGNYELPYGSLVWANDDDLAACLLPTDTGKPLTQVALLSLSSGNSTVVLEQAVGSDEGFEIYDVRATSSGLIWAEADILDGVWRIYTARTDGAALGNPALVEEGDGDWEMPTIAAVGNRAFWQVLPKASGPKKTEPSLFKRATMGANDIETLWTSIGRMATAPYATGDSVVITPRTDTSSIHYQLVRVDANTGEALDTMALPTSMKPLEAGYGNTGFMFSFDAGYQYGGGIASIGTYTPASAVTNGDYSNAPWFLFSRNPTAPPAWCGSYLMVKSRTQVVGINFDTNDWFAFDVKSGADDYGEYLASTGSRDAVVTYTNIDDKPLDGEARKYCLVRVWTPA